MTRTITTRPSPHLKEVEVFGFVRRQDGTSTVEPCPGLYAPRPPEADRLHELRRELDLNLGEAARVLGLTAAQLSRLERGHILPVEGWEAAYEALEMHALLVKLLASTAEVVAIVGRNGVGKSDLLRELERLASMAKEATVPFFVDNFGAGLHPLDLKERQEELLARAKEEGRRVFLITTHPYAVDGLDPEGVFVVAKGGGRLRGAWLVEHPEAAKWLDMMRPGEFWSSVGEEWALESGKS